MCETACVALRGCLDKTLSLTTIRQGAITVISAFFEFLILWKFLKEVSSAVNVASQIWSSDKWPRFCISEGKQDAKIKLPVILLRIDFQSPVVNIQQTFIVKSFSENWQVQGHYRRQVQCQELSHFDSWPEYSYEKSLWATTCSELIEEVFDVKLNESF